MKTKFCFIKTSQTPKAGITYDAVIGVDASYMKGDNYKRKSDYKLVEFIDLEDASDKDSIFSKYNPIIFYSESVENSKWCAEIISKSSGFNYEEAIAKYADKLEEVLEGRYGNIETDENGTERIIRCNNPSATAVVFCGAIVSVS